MDVFEVHDHLIDDYQAFTSGFTEIHDQRIRDHVDDRLQAGDQWPEPYLSLNPNFASGGSIPELVAQDLLHPECERIFRVGKDQPEKQGYPLDLHQHQREAIEIARGGASYVLTTGTGSGKSLSYLVPIVDSVLRQRDAGAYRPGVKAIIVYPMNALANSQRNELEKFLRHGYPDGTAPVTFERYTGQDREAERAAILANPPDILLTNYVMLELLLTRPDERERLITASEDLRFLVLDELHTYRGRSGADVGLLVRRLRETCSAGELQCVGTSATLTTQGTESDRRRTVAGVASKLFGTPVSHAHIVGETLQRATTGDADDREQIARRIPSGVSTQDHKTFVADPLAAWVERCFGVTEAPGTGRLVRPSTPRTVAAAAAVLAHETGTSDADCRTAIQRTLQRGAALTDPRTRRPTYAFRLHQFLSKGDNVYLSLELPSSRYITSRYQTVAPEPTDTTRILLPAVFCRECGQEYLAAQRVDDEGSVRFESSLSTTTTDATSGYLFISDDLPWPESADVAISEHRLPETWLVTADDGTVSIAPRRVKYLPTRVRLDETGTQVDHGGAPFAFIEGSFAFCLRCRTSYEQLRSNDFGKLASLAAEGRSSAASVISASIVRSLREQPELHQEAQKLLAFADNRQDASLQAGHFNDFIQVTQLRGALYRALCDEPDGLSHEVIEQRVTDALDLSLADFAQDEEARFSRERKAREALRKVVGYRLYQDLERGWRVTMPNLEQTGLLRVDYLDLPELSADRQSWEGRHVALRDDDAEHRLELMRILLDELRRVLAIDVDCFGDIGFEQLQKLSNQHLREPWALPEREQKPVTGIAFPRTGGKGGRREHLYLSGYGAYGRFLLRPGQFPPSVGKLTRKDAQDIIVDLLEVMAREGILVEVREPTSEGPGYRLKASTIIWRVGDGKSGADDPLRKQVASETGPRVNPFFLRLYSDVASTLAGLHAREHTAQVSNEARIEREDKFRAGALPVLFCSPTMELGIDIADLNAVGLRNVPPTPANYAQRAGRAGRSGQPALVVTYCATGNAHDHYYFRHRADMVAGAVEPPRLDLTNEDLLRSHVHAIWLAETGVELDRSLAKVVDTGSEGYPLLNGIRDRIEDDAARQHAIPRVWHMIHDQWDELVGTSWWHDDWVERVTEDASKEFDRALERWRQLFRSAIREQEAQNKIILDHATSHKTRELATQRRREAENQLRLLRLDDTEDFQTDFYSYRYLAAEGFLPGYSFPRLPLRAYVPGRRGMSRDAEFIHRPRFIAISEFGPGALVYHEGLRYQVNQVQLSPGADGDTGLDTSAARRCACCGYQHDSEVGVDVCESCHNPLGQTMHRLLRLQTVKASRRDRISSDEEERRRSGFDLITSYRFNEHGARPGRTSATASVGDGPVLDLTYGDTATVRVTNLGLRRRKDAEETGYWIDVRSGAWLSERKAQEAVAETDLDDVESAQRAQKVIPYVEDSRNILVTRFATVPVDEGAALSFMYALERGIEAEFQLEESELYSELLPDPDGRGRALFIESAEGGAGVLRRLVAEPGALRRAARRALEICHFEPNTGDDTGGVDEAGERCARACYECLLSYRNQGNHLRIDRHLARDPLLACVASTTTKAGDPDVTGTWNSVQNAVQDTGHRERLRFVEWLREMEYRSPDEVDVSLPEFGGTADLVYRTAGGPVAVYVDGPEDADAPGRDEEMEDALRDAGWFVIRVTSGANYPEIVARYPSVFGTTRRVRR